MASNLRAMASNLIAMASNLHMLRTSDFLIGLSCSPALCKGVPTPERKRILAVVRTVRNLQEKA